uniref:Golgin subfamily A member 2 n=1 Tax=Anthurium amnicola TaxID=1678845 RepID=A0A1D1XVP1_9ARAE
MGFDVSHLTRMQCEGALHSSFKALDSKKVLPSRHKRCQSDPHKRLEEHDLHLSPEAPHHLKKNVGLTKDEPDAGRQPSPDAMVQSSLKQEILQLEKRLQDQFAVRRALEKALGYRSSTVDTSNDNLMPKPTKELIREIAVLEVEVRYLEQYLLSLYRKAFDEQVSILSSPTAGKRSEPPSSSQTVWYGGSGTEIPPKQGSKSDKAYHTPVARKLNTTPTNEVCFAGCPRRLTGPDVHRSHSALSQRSICSGRMSPQAENIARALRECHSQPLSFLENEPNSTSEVISLAEYLGTNITDHVPETPNKLSEDLVKCMGSIYCKLAESPLVYPGFSSSPTSSFSSMGAFSPQHHGDMWSPGRRKESSLDAWLDNPFRVEGLKEFSGPYNVMVEVPSFCLNGEKLVGVKDMLQRYKSLALRLESVDPRKMKHEEKLAFWINIHNASVMHAYLTNGVPPNNLKRVGFLVKAMCNVGGQIISADTIQNSILGCRTHRPGQWLRALLSPGSKTKKVDEWQTYAIEHPEPLLHFTLCSGSHSDPAVRVYTPKRVLQELEKAREQYIRAAVSIRREQKILLPKIIETFAKDSNLSLAGLLDMIQHYLPQTIQMAMRRCQQGKSQKVVEWVPHNFTFRYLLSREVANPDII